MMCSSMNIASSAPDEVITRIAMELIPLHSKQHHNLISMSHVCKSWREAIISYPLLWNTIDNNGEMVTRMCLERSKSVPLKVSLSDFDTWSSNSRCLVGSHAGRFEELSLTGSLPRDLSEMFRSLVPSEKPLLRGLTLWNTTTLDTASLTVHEPPRSPLLSADIPTLHKLHLGSFPLTPQLSALRHLTDLELIDPGPTATNAVLDLLANNPRLERVAIVDMSDDHGSHRRDQGVALPHLHQFLAYQCSAIDILRCLHLPRSESLEIEIQRSFEHCPLPRAYQPYSTLDLAWDFGFRETRIYNDSEFYLKVSDWSDGGMIAEFKELPPDDAEVLGPSTVEFISHLHFQENRKHSIRHSPNAFRHLGRLETLTLDCLTASLKEIFAMLIEVTFCPLLDTLIVRLLDGKGVGEWRVSLFDVVSARANAGHAIRRLRVVVSSEEGVTAYSRTLNPFVQEVEVLVREREGDDGSWLIWGD